MRISFCLVGLLLCCRCFANDLTSLDSAFYSHFKGYAETIAKAHLPTNQSGLIGRNKKWKALYSPRFQLGAGFALRISLLAKRKEPIQLAFRAIEVATDAIDEGGRVNSVIPASIAKGRELSDTDIASAAAFFLGDACLGISALLSSDPILHHISNKRSSRVSNRLTAATNWLSKRTSLLESADAQAPNRLLFNARTFSACSQLEKDLVRKKQFSQIASTFSELAFIKLSKSGYFIEKGGYDTSYQAVAIVLAEELIHIDPQFDTSFQKEVTQASTWLARRVDQSGRLDSSGNTRTCAGGEHFIGRPKKVALIDVFKALAYTGVRTKNQVLLTKAELLASWVEKERHSPSFDPCYESN